MKQFTYFVLAIRPYQWTKNFLVFAAIIFSGNLFHLPYVKISILTFIFFCCASGSIYVFNDIIDRKGDAIHPEKKHRPIAAGLLRLPVAVVGAIILMIIAITGAFSISTELGAVISSYIGLTLLYTIILKQIVIIDILVVAIGFVLRAIAGAVAIQVMISTWLVVCAFFLALFLIIGKRRHELVSLQHEAANHRKILDEYNPKLLDQMVVVVTAATVVAYALYTRDPETIQRFQTTHLIYTIPFVIYGLFRYFYLIYKLEIGGRPEKVFLNDRGILLAILGWILTVGFIIY